MLQIVSMFQLTSSFVIAHDVKNQRREEIVLLFQIVSKLHAQIISSRSAMCSTNITKVLAVHAEICHCGTHPRRWCETIQHIESHQQTTSQRKVLAFFLPVLGNVNDNEGTSCEGSRCRELWEDDTGLTWAVAETAVACFRQLGSSYDDSLELNIGMLVCESVDAHEKGR